MTTKIPVELSSTPGIVDNSNATAITIDSNEDVTVNNGTLTSSGANGVGNQGFHITDTGYSKTHKLFGDNSLHIQADSGQSILMKPNASEIARFTSNGLTFNGDTAAANALDDYEEGSFDAHIRNAANDAILVSATGNGRYVKIGRFVFVTIQIYQNSVSSTTLSSSYNYIQMPFTSASNFNASGFYPMYYAGVGNIKAGYISSNTTKLYMSTNRDTPLTHLAGTETVGGSVRFYGDLVYMAET